MTSSASTAEAAATLSRYPPRDRDAVMMRVASVLAACGRSPSGGSLRALRRLLEDSRPDELWLAVGVLGAELPTGGQVVGLRRRIAQVGAGAAVAELVGRRAGVLRAWAPDEVEVAVGKVLVDVHHTCQTALATGIQRVARESVRRWHRDHDIVLVRWDPWLRALRRTTEQESAAALGHGPPPPPGRLAGTRQVIVPFASTVLVPELVTEAGRSTRLGALARYSGNRTGVIGFDLVPITSSETVADGMAGAFAATLAAVRHFDKVATISAAAATEYRGWARMLHGTGLPGPDITAITLPVEANHPPQHTLSTTRARYTVPGVPMILVVGSHEPRKNHLAVLHTAERLWRDGLTFTLVFVGGNSWNSATFTTTATDLRAAGRPLDLVTSLPDDDLWALYHLAHTVLFPSLNEGYGLPAAEALAAGTPVITSNYGSMAEIAATGGALTIDPRHPNHLTTALRTILTDPHLHTTLTNATPPHDPKHTTRTWDHYAHDTWHHLTS